MQAKFLWKRVRIRDYEQKWQSDVIDRAGCANIAHHVIDGLRIGNASSVVSD